MPIGVCCALTARIASAMPGASRAMTAHVASGVMSSGVRPVPPVVKTKVTPCVDVVVQAVLDEREVVGHDLHRHDLGARVLGEMGEQRARAVLGLAARDAAGDGHDDGAHCAGR